MKDGVLKFSFRIGGGWWIFARVRQGWRVEEEKRRVGGGSLFLSRPPFRNRRQTLKKSSCVLLNRRRLCSKPCIYLWWRETLNPPHSTTTPPTLLRNPACECQETERVVVIETEREEGGGFGLCIELPKLIPREHSVLRSPPTQAPRPSTHTLTHIHAQGTRMHTHTQTSRWFHL